MSRDPGPGGAADPDSPGEQRGDDRSADGPGDGGGPGSDDSDESTDAPALDADVATRRWEVAVAAAAVAAAAGLLLNNVGALLVAVAAGGFAIYARVSPVPEPSVAVERDLSTTDPHPGETVDVEVTVRNEGAATLADVRLADGVPDALAVVDGDHRAATALRPGEAHTLSYAVLARQGDHRFDPARVAVRDPAGTAERVVEAGPAASVTCRTLLDELPPVDRAARFFGRLSADSGGAGVEFYATREYRAGDPLSRVDWNRLAKDGELTSVQFREQRAATVVVVLDARPPARRTAGEATPDAVELGAYAADRAVVTLVDAGHRVGLAVLGDGLDVVDPAAGSDREARRALPDDAEDFGPPVRSRGPRSPAAGASAAGTDVAARNGRPPTPKASHEAVRRAEAEREAAGGEMAGGDDVAAGDDKAPDGDGTATGDGQHPPGPDPDGQQRPPEPDPHPGRDPPAPDPDEGPTPSKRAAGQRAPDERPSNASRASTRRGADVQAGDRPTADRRSLRARLPAGAQVLFVSPLLDDAAVETVQDLRAHDHPTTVLSVDVTDEESTGGRLAALARRRRLRSLRAAGVRTVDWPFGQPLPVALSRAIRRWLA